MRAFGCAAIGFVASLVIGVGASGPERHAWLTSALAFAITVAATIADSRHP